MKRALSTAFSCAVPFVVFYLLEAAASFLIYFAALGLSGAWGRSLVDEPSFPLFMTAAVNFSIAPVLYVLFRTDLYSGRRGIDRSLTIRPRVYAAAAAGILGFYFPLMIFMSLAGFGEADAAFQEVDSSIMSASVPVQFLAAGVSAPLVEELLFRGLLGTRAAKGFGPYPALFISALCFGIFHGNLTQGTAAAVMGLFLGYAYMRTGALLVPVVMHAAVNTAAILLSAWPGGAPRGLPACMAATVLSAAGIGLYLKTFCGPQGPQEPEETA